VLVSGSAGRRASGRWHDVRRWSVIRSGPSAWPARSYAVMPEHPCTAARHLSWRDVPLRSSDSIDCETGSLETIWQSLPIPRLSTYRLQLSSRWVGSAKKLDRGEKRTPTPGKVGATGKVAHGSQKRALRLRWEGEAPAEPWEPHRTRLGRSLALPAHDGYRRPPVRRAAHFPAEFVFPKSRVSPGCSWLALRFSRWIAS
jgi:hypothetical protein